MSGNKNEKTNQKDNQKQQTSPAPDSAFSFVTSGAAGLGVFHGLRQNAQRDNQTKAAQDKSIPSDQDLERAKLPSSVPGASS